MNRKKLIAIFATITISTTLVASVLLLQLSQAAAGGYDPDYMTVEGVLASDKYTLYPYETADSLKIGFSKYGEMIDSDTCVGLEYGDVDAFAAPVGPDVISSLPKSYWMQGWFMNITYEHASWGSRNVWAMATFADMIDYGGPWLRVDWGSDDIDSAEDEPGLYGLETPEDPGYEIPGGAVLRNGGRKTNGTAVTEPIKVLYDGPRRFVALLSTTISDHRAPSPDEALVRLNITIVFNKVKKEVNLFKDVKSVISWKILEGEMNVQFSNRGQVDLGTEAGGFESYAHFYTEGIGMYDVSEEGQPTVYDSEYTLIRTETPCKIYNGTATGGNNTGLEDDTSPDWPVEDLADYKVAILSGTGVGQVRTIASNGTEAGDDWLIVTSAWTTNPESGSVYGIYDPTICKTADGRFPQTSATNATYDLAQAVNPTAGYVWSAAFWPSLSDWSIDGWSQKYRSLDALDPHYINLYTSDSIDEPEVPFYIGEWDFLLGHSGSSNNMFRGVTAYSVIDQHDASDAQITGGSDVIDKEIQYLMNEKFNPYDLYSAVEKDKTRWVDFFTGDGETTDFRLTEGILNLQTFNPDGTDGAISWQLDKDLPFRGSEKALNMSTEDITEEDGTISQGAAICYSVNMKVSEFEEFVYHFWLPEGVDAPPEPSWPPHMCFYLQGASDPTEYADVTLMPSTQWAEHGAATEEWVAKTITGSTGGFAGQAMDTISEFSGEPAYPGVQTLAEWFDDCPDCEILWISIEFGGWGGTAYDGGYCFVDDVSLNDDSLTPKRGELVYDENSITADQLGETPEWDEYCSFTERVLVDGVLQERDVDYTINITAKDESYWANAFSGNPTLIFDADSIPADGAVIKVLYSTEPEGSYEWIVAGKDAATIDSIGAAYMTEAFDSLKHIDVQVTGLDINDTVNGPYAPFVMGYGALTGIKTDYRDTLGRTYLRDDWCTAYPVSSSNMLFSGGPLANLGAEYFNEFTNAFWARPDYVVNDTGHASTILALSCWNKNNYTSTLSALYGYAVVSVYKDINGTIGFLIWGHEGQDTYYAAKWFWDEGIVDLQTENRGVTDIILQIYYSAADPTHPTVSIIEHLGTISEKPQHDCP